MTEYGAAHVAGLYHVTSPGTGSFVLDGFELIKDIGFSGVKFFLSQQYISQDYLLEPAWSGVPTSLKTLAQLSEFSTAFADANVNLFFLNTFAFSTSDESDLWKFPLRDQTTLLTDQYNEFYDLADHLLSTYSGKTFILQNWEGDWALRGGTAEADFNNITGRRVDRMVAFYQTRARAIEDARKANQSSTTQVLHAIECNRVIDSLHDSSFPSVANIVLPRLRGSIDLVSYSAYDSVFNLPIGGGGGGAYYTDQNTMLAAIETKLPAAFALLEERSGVPVFIGEWGIDENATPGGYDDATIIQKVYDVAVDYGIPYHVYWQVFNNEAGKLYALYNSGGSKTNAGNKWEALL